MAWRTTMRVLLLLAIIAGALAQTNGDIVVKVALLQMMPSTTQNQTFNTLKAMANYPAPLYNGQSVAYDDQGNQLVLAGPDEGVYYAAINITAIRTHRLTSIWGDAYRRPASGAYNLLCAQGREPSFQGPNAFSRPRIW